MGDELADARNVYRLQLGGKRLCEALRKIADGCDDPKAVAKEALNHKAPDPDWNALVLPFIQAERERAYVDAWDTARGSNADLCRTSGAAYRLIVDRLKAKADEVSAIRSRTMGVGRP